MMPFDSALDLATSIRERRISVVEAVEFALEQIDRLNPELGAVVYRRDELALDEAAKADQWLGTRPDGIPTFFGVPTLIKDLTEVRGDKVTHGSKAFAHKTGTYDATVVTRIKEGGMIHVGRTNSPEFGSLPITENQLHGPTRNPYHHGHTPGGSSGGAASAVAAKMVPLAHASDGGGSIRIPASCCGLVGLKAQRGRVPKGPWVTEILHGLSTDGCVSNTVKDTAAFLDLISFRDPFAWFGVESKPGAFSHALTLATPKLRIAYTTRGPITARVDDICLKGMLHVAEELRSQGHEVFEVSLPWGLSEDELLKDFITLWASAGAYMPSLDLNTIEPFNRGLRTHGLSTSSFDYVAAVARLQVFSRQFLLEFNSRCDLLITPTLAIEPPPIGWHFDGPLADDGSAQVMEMMLRACALTPYTCLANITGQPAISIPAIKSPKGLPIGVQMMGPPMGEDLLLKVARDLEPGFNLGR